MNILQGIHISNQVLQYIHVIYFAMYAYIKSSSIFCNVHMSFSAVYSLQCIHTSNQVLIFCNVDIYILQCIHIFCNVYIYQIKFCNLIYAHLWLSIIIQQSWGNKKENNSPFLKTGKRFSPSPAPSLFFRKSLIENSCPVCLKHM